MSMRQRKADGMQRLHRPEGNAIVFRRLWSGVQMQMCIEIALDYGPIWVGTTSVSIFP